MNNSSAALIRDLLAHTENATAEMQRLIVDCPGKSEEADFLMQQLEAFERVACGLQTLLDAANRSQIGILCAPGDGTALR